MLKKNLHFFTRCLILFFIIVIFLPLTSCHSHEENYLSFLDGDLAFDCDIEYNEEKIAKAEVKKSSESITITFTSPSSLKGTTLNISQNKSIISHNGKDISDAVIPKLWLAVMPMLRKDKRILAVTSENGITEIHTENDMGTFDYKIDDNGKLICIDNGNINLWVKETD